MWAGVCEVKWHIQVSSEVKIIVVYRNLKWINVKEVLYKCNATTSFASTVRERNFLLMGWSRCWSLLSINQDQEQSYSLLVLKFQFPRMHSSRMRTGRSLTVCRSLLLGGGVSALGGVYSKGVSAWGVSALGGCLLRRGGFCSGGVSAPGGCLLHGGVCSGGLSARGVCGIPTCTEADIPPVDRITDACKNITLATTSLRPVINLI